MNKWINLTKENTTQAHPTKLHNFFIQLLQTGSMIKTYIGSIYRNIFSINLYKYTQYIYICVCVYMYIYSTPVLMSIGTSKA